MVNGYLDFLLTLLAQFAGGPGPIENNLMRFGLPVVLWGVLWAIAWYRQRQQELPREKWLVWGFGLGFFRELYMFSHVAALMLGGVGDQAGYSFTEPLEHALAMAAIVVIAAAFLRYILDNTLVARRYLLLGLAVTGTGFLVTVLWWPRYVTLNPAIKFHQTWGAGLFHLSTSVFIVAALVLLYKKQGWLRNTVSLALIFFLLSEFKVIGNFATSRAYQFILCPIGNSFYTLAIAVLGYVYIRELFIERHQAEEALKAYRDHLEDLVDQRTVELTGTNTQLQQEITERMRAEEALRQSEARFRRVISSISDHIYMTEITETGERINRYLSPNVTDLTGYPLEAFMADWNFWPARVIHPDDQAIATAHALHLPMDHQSDIEYRLVRADGQTIWVRDSTRIEEQGSSKVVYGVVGDITERKRAEAALEHLSRQNQLILNSTGEGIFGVDLEGNHTFVNPAAARMLGYQPHELTARPSHATWHHSKPDGTPYPETECPLHAGYKTGEVCYGDDQVFWRKDGASFPVRYMSSPIHEKGTLTGAVVVFQDITERKRAEAEIAQRNAQLAAQNAIAATISQSLRLDTILTTALDTVLHVLDVELGGLYLLESDYKTLSLQIHQGVSAELSLESVQRLRVSDQGFTRAVTEMKPVVEAVPKNTALQQHPFIIAEQVQTMASTPLISQGRALGMLILGARRPNAISPQELEMLTSIGQQIGMAVQNARLYRETEQRGEELALLHQVSVVLNSTLDPAEIYDQITEQSIKLLGCQASVIFRWDEEQRQAVGISSYGLDGQGIEGLSIPASHSCLLPELTTRRQSIPIEHGQTDPRVCPLWRDKLNVRSLLCVPLWSADKPLAFLFMIEQRQSRQWYPSEIKLVESFVNRAAIALENAHLHEQVERAAALEERQRIAAEMHDGLAQTLSYLGHKVDRTAYLVSAGQIETMAGEYDHIRQIIDQASHEVRQSIASLQEKPRLRQPLQERLADIVTEFTGNGGPPAELVINCQSPLFLPLEQLEQVMRVVQESLTNVIRHAQAKRVTLCLEKQGADLAIIIEDDGRGFEPDQPATDGRDHFGLRIMRARAARIGGRVTIDSAPEQGVRVTLTWPLSVDTTEPEADRPESAATKQSSILTVV